MIISCKKYFNNTNHPDKKNSNQRNICRNNQITKYHSFKRNTPMSSVTVVVRWNIYLQAVPKISNN